MASIDNASTSLDTLLRDTSSSSDVYYDAVSWIFYLPIAMIVISAIACITCDGKVVMGVGVFQTLCGILILSLLAVEDDTALIAGIATTLWGLFWAVAGGQLIYEERLKKSLNWENELFSHAFAVDAESDEELGEGTAMKRPVLGRYRPIQEHPPKSFFSLFFGPALDPPQPQHRVHRNESKRSIMTDQSESTNSSYHD